MSVNCYWGRYVIILLSILLIRNDIAGQTFNYKTTEGSEIIHGHDFEVHGFPDTMTVWCNDWDFITTNPTTWGNDIKLKSNNSFVKLAVDPFYSYAYLSGAAGNIFSLAYDVYGFNNPSDTVTGFTLISDTLSISCDGANNSRYQDIAMHKYSNFYKIIIVLKEVFRYDYITNVYSTFTLSSTPFSNLALQNFYVEGSIVTQRFDKDAYGSGTGAPILYTMPFSDESNNNLRLFWNLTSGDTTALQLTPANYELEWTYVDDYERDIITGTVTTLAPSSVKYDFTNNSTRVWLDSNFYNIPLVYNSGYVVYRVRSVRPDSIQYKYPIYGPWSLTANSGYISGTSSDCYYQLSAPYKNDSINWQYTVSFAEGGKYKHVMSFYDGMLKNRQSITRLNTNPNKLIVTQNVYDYEGRPAIKTLPTPVSSSGFSYKYNVALDSVTGLPFEAGYFDTGFALCPYQPVISPLADDALASIYYSNNNPDTAGFQKFVPDAEGYPFLHTIYKPGHDQKIQYQGGAGPALQPGDSNCFQFFYGAPNQKELDMLFGQNIGWKSYYKSTVSMDPNQQLSVSVKDYEGKQVLTALIGPGPNPQTHALRPNDVPDSFSLNEDLLYGQTQTVIGYTKVADFDFFNEAVGPDTIQYFFTYNPYPLCPGQSLSVKAHYHYDVIDQCGDIVVSQDSVLGVNGLITTPLTFAGNMEIFAAGVAPYHVHKQLSIDPVDVDAALDSFFAAPPSCFLDLPYFIRRAVESKQFPCPAPLRRSPCDEKKWEMMQELFPHGKYGGYGVGGSGYVGSPNSIFEIIDGGMYRYKDTCTEPHLLDTITVCGVFYAHLRSLPLDSFITVFSRAVEHGDYRIAEQLLCLHPEYCKLQACFEDTFKTQLSEIPDYVVAEKYNRLYLDSVIAHDPLVPIMNTVFSISTADDSLRTFKGGLRRIDKSVLSNAYCACSDSIMFKHCANDMYAYEIANGLLINKRIKQAYFEDIRDIYLSNRERFISEIIVKAGDSCSNCALTRLTLVPSPVFDPTITDSGTIILDTLEPYASFSGPSSMTWLASLGSTVFVDSMDSTMTALYDSATLYYTSTDSSLCYGQVDTILARLSNCIAGDTVIMAGIRNTLDSLCFVHAITNGNYTPEHIRYALVQNGVPISDLCNPYVVSYIYTPETADVSQNCREDTFYRAATNFLNDTTVTIAFHTPGTIVNYTLSPTDNVFENDMYNLLGANAVVRFFSSYDTSSRLLELFVFNNPSIPGVSLTDTVKIFLRSPLYGNIYDTTADSFHLSVACVSTVPQYLTTGVINEFSFISNVTRYNGTLALTTSMLCWTDSVDAMYSVTNPINNCIPCTQMRDLYNRFNDTLIAYGIKGTDHPYYGELLANFVNDELKRVYDVDQLETFIESCALADSMKMKVYTGYATYRFADSLDMVNFIDSLNAIDTDYAFNSSMYIDRDTTDTITVCVNINHVPLEILWRYKHFFSTYGGTYASRIVNQPLSTLQPANSLGFLYTPVTYPFSPADSAIIDVADSVTFTSYNKSVWDAGHFVPVTFYSITHTATAPPYRISKNGYDIESFLYNHGIPYVQFFPNYQSTINEDYFKPEKKAFLQYTYGLQHLPPYRVLDSLQANYLTANIPSYSGYTVDYNSLFGASTSTNLYMSGPGMVSQYWDTLLYILNTVSDSNLIDTGHVFFDSSRLVILNNVDSPLIAYRCSDGTYWYRYFGYGDTLYSVCVAFPEYIPDYERKLYKIVSVNPAPGDSASKFFTLSLRKPGDTTIVTAVGMASFVTDYTIVLKNVLLGESLTAAMKQPWFPFSNCEQDRLRYAQEEGRVLYKEYIDSMVNAITAHFTEYLMDSVEEQLYLSYLNNKFGITLYHYDRAGNLIRTVPPMGVAPVPISLLNTIDASRMAGVTSSFFDPAYSKENIYNYNSLNQVTNQTTINGGSTTYFYDPVGRLILSQNNKQAPSSMFTYNIYDKQGRVVETGQVNLGSPVFSSYAYDDMATDIRSHDRTDVVFTVYDTEAVNLFAAAHIDRQENLRKRVAAVKYFDIIYNTDLLFLNYTYATHYSYDIDGNLKTLTNDFPTLASIRQQYKRVDYDYDLVSGKVNMLSYNRGHADQFYQRYRYDADNRIQSVQTSADGYIWDNDVSYAYYEHGPLARMDIGTNHVQGVDFAYTIQGWLKAMNGDTLGTELDMAQDGVVGVSSYGADILAHTIDYFKNDYKPIGGWQMQHVPQQVLNLYNGNIARQTVAIGNPGFAYKPLHKQYLYDQFNRIINADYYKVNAAAGTITARHDYHNEYTYDLDGNILTLLRKDSRPILPDNDLQTTLDSFIYHYAGGTSNNDLLTDLHDCVVENAYDLDVPSYCPPAFPPAPARYTYDPTGNTTQDLVNAQDTIQWNLYNKVARSVNTTDTSEMTFTYDGAGNRVAKTYKKNTPDDLRIETDYYVHDAQGNTLAIYHQKYRDSTGYPKLRSFGLAAHDMYGSSRLGEARYSPKIVGREVSYNVADTINDTTRLYTHLPWYSLEYQDGIHPDSLSPYGNTWMDTVHARHRTGERNYEMTDHLGNVMVSITDQLRMRTYDTIAGYPPGSNNPVLATSYQPGYSSTCDYYPFGMPMPNSFTGEGDEYVPSYTAELDDFPVHRWYPIRDRGLNSGCATCNIDTMATAGLTFTSGDVSIIDTYTAPASYSPLPDAISNGNWMARYRIGGLHLNRINRVRVSVTGASMPLSLNWFIFKLYHADYSSGITATNLYSAPGVVTMTLVPTAAADTALVLAIGWRSAFPVSVGTSYSLTIDSVLVDYDTVILLDNVMAQVGDDGGYNYGYNGQMKNNKWAGFGNHNTAQFWEYDTRVARRANLDPKPCFGISEYSVFNNNPIWNYDLLGDEWKNGEEKAKNDAEKAKNDAEKNLAEAQRQYEELMRVKASEDAIDKAKAKIKQYNSDLNNATKNYDEAKFKYDIIESSLAELKEENPDFYDYWDKKTSADNNDVLQNVVISVRASYALVDDNNNPVPEKVYYGTNSEGVYYASPFVKISSENRRKPAEWNSIYRAKAEDISHAVGHLWLLMKHMPHKASSYNAPGEKNARTFAEGLKNGLSWPNVQSQKYIMKDK